YAHGFRTGLLQNNLAHCAEAGAAISLILGLTSLFRNRLRLARWMVAVFAASIVIGWAAAQYPYLARPDMTVYNSALSENVVRDVLLALIAGVVVLFPSLALLLYVFKDQRKRPSNSLAFDKIKTEASSMKPQSISALSIVKESPCPPVRT